MNTKVLLVRPPQLFYFGVWPRGPRLSIPTGLLSIGSYLKNNNIDVSIYDSFVEGSDFNKNELSDKHKYKKSKHLRSNTRKWIDWDESSSLGKQELNELNEFVHFGSSWKEFSEYLENETPHVIGITNLFRENTEETIKTAKLIKTILPNSIVVVGGPNANAIARELIDKCPEIDIIGLRDGEEVMLSVVKLVEGQIEKSSIKDIIYKDNIKGFIETEAKPLVMDLDQYGKMHYDLIKLERYFTYERNGIMARNKFLYKGSERSVSLVTSRGCPYKCTFCSIHIHAGRKFRRNSAEFVVSQIEELVDKYNVKHFHFEDDNLTLDKARFNKIFETLYARGVKFTWDTPNGVFASSLDKKMLKLIKKTGCTYLIIGVESGDQNVLDTIVKKQPLKLKQVEDVFKLSKKLKIDLHAFYIIGFPRETLANINTTLGHAYNALKKYNVIPHLSLARADPGTDLYKEALEHKNLVTDFKINNAGGVKSDMFKRHLIKNDHFTPEFLEDLNDRFHKKCIRLIFRKTTLLFIKHPVLFFKIVYKILKNKFSDKLAFKDVLVKYFWCKLLYKNALIEDYKNKNI